MVEDPGLFYDQTKGSRPPKRLVNLREGLKDVCYVT